MLLLKGRSKNLGGLQKVAPKESAFGFFSLKSAISAAWWAALLAAS
jgi:hypothetical protein